MLMLNAQRPRTETNTNTLRTLQQMRKIYTWYRIDWERPHSRVCVWEGRENSQGKTENISNSLSAVRQTWRTVQLMRKMYYVMECNRIYTGYSMDLERRHSRVSMSLSEKARANSQGKVSEQPKNIINTLSAVRQTWRIGGTDPFPGREAVKNCTFSGVT